MVLRTIAWLKHVEFHTDTIQFLVDNYKYDIDPDVDFITERTSKRKMNILDIPIKHSHRQHFDRDGIATGRPLSPERIVAPRPSKPVQAYSHFTTSNKSREIAIETLSRRLAYAKMDSSDESEFASDSDVPSDRPSSHTSSSDDEPDRERSRFSSNSSDSESSRGLSPITPTDDDSDRGSPPVCYCHKYGITRSGQKLKIDCNGKDCHFRPLPLPSIRKDDSRGSRARIEERKPSSSHRDHRDSRYEGKSSRRW